MKKLMTLGSFLLILLISSCGAENDARDVCNCYKEVLELKDEEADDKMMECLDLLSKYLQSHEEAGTLEEFNEAYNKCR
jgi:pyrroloquinoline quinone (PQQ) biosynthesis protein C